MRDEDCIAFLQWGLPRLKLRWAGYRKVRRTVCKRLRRRLRELNLDRLAAYRGFLENHPEEWARLDALCRIPISRFYRDRGVFDCLADRVLPALAADAAARGVRKLHCWSAGCASGEEVYTLRMLWDLSVQPIRPDVRFEILGSDADAILLRRAEAARYRGGSLKDLPAAWRDAAFTRDGEAFVLRPEFRRDVAFQEADIRRGQPDGPFDLVLCRNLAFTYFAPGLQEALQRAIAARLAPGGYLVIGAHERLPAEAGDFVSLAPKLPIYRKAPAPA
ncbi:MAG: chemotaxis protein CheR [Proteobacteria bacterium]|nr:chemotaxis protein CheR [Pseudomonadota bacterium]